MDVFVVEGLEQAGDVGIEAGNEGEVAAVGPPMPVLHDGVEGNVLVAVLDGDLEELAGALVSVFGLEEAVGPLAEERRLPGHCAILVDDLVHLRAVEEVVVDGVACVGGEDHFAVEAVVELGSGGGVPEQAVALGGDEQRYGDLGIGLRELDDVVAEVHRAALMLAKPVERLFDGQIELLLHAQHGVAVPGDGLIFARDVAGFGQQHGFGFIEEDEAAGI